MDRMILNHELQRYTDAELRALFDEVHRVLAQTAPGTPQRRNALASLENIRRVIAQRLAKSWHPAPSP